MSRFPMLSCLSLCLCLSLLSMLSGQRARGMRKHFRFADVGQPWRIRNIAKKRMKWQEIVIIVAPTLHCLRYRWRKHTWHMPSPSTLGQYTSHHKSLSRLEARLGWKSGEQFVKKLNEIYAELKNDKQTNNVWGWGGGKGREVVGGRSATRAARISAMVAFSLR